MVKLGFLDPIHIIRISGDLGIAYAPEARPDPGGQRQQPASYPAENTENYAILNPLEPPLQVHLISGDVPETPEQVTILFREPNKFIWRALIGRVMLETHWNSS